MRARHHRERSAALKWSTHSPMPFLAPQPNRHLTEAERIAARMLERTERQPRPPPTIRRFSWEAEQ